MGPQASPPSRASLILRNAHMNAHVAVTQHTWEPLSHCGRTCGIEAMSKGGLVAFPVMVLWKFFIESFHPARTTLLIRHPGS